MMTLNKDIFSRHHSATSEESLHMFDTILYYFLMQLGTLFGVMLPHFHKKAPFKKVVLNLKKGNELVVLTTI